MSDEGLEDVPAPLPIDGVARELKGNEQTLDGLGAQNVARIDERRRAGIGIEVKLLVLLASDFLEDSQ